MDYWRVRKCTLSYFVVIQPAIQKNCGENHIKPATQVYLQTYVVSAFFVITNSSEKIC